MNIKIFLFHRVSSQRDVLWDPITPEKFDEIIRFLAKKYTLVQLEKTILQSETIKTTKPIAAVVFDDGYKDFMEFALPVLKKYQCPSSMYVVTNCVETHLPPWTYILDYHFIHSKKLELDVDKTLLPATITTTKFKDVDSRLQFARQFKPYLKKVSNQLRVSLCNQVLASLNDVQVPADLIMNWDELKQIKNEGVEIGSHTMSHPLLNKLEQESEIVQELKGSAELIAKNLGNYPLCISYPIGGYNETVKTLAIKNGYKMGLAVNQITYNRELHNTFEIPRIELYNESMLKTKLRISGTISLINNFLKL